MRCQACLAGAEAHDCMQCAHGQHACTGLWPEPHSCRAAVTSWCCVWWGHAAAIQARAKLGHAGFWAWHSNVRVLAQLAAPDELESKFKNLEGDDVDDELAAMKKRTLTGATASSSKPEKQLPEGRPIRCAGCCRASGPFGPCLRQPAAAAAAGGLVPGHPHLQGSWQWPASCTAARGAQLSRDACCAGTPSTLSWRSYGARRESSSASAACTVLLSVPGSATGMVMVLVSVQAHQHTHEQVARPVSGGSVQNV